MALEVHQTVILIFFFPVVSLFAFLAHSHAMIFFCFVVKIDSHSFANSAAVNAVFVDFVAFLFVQITSIQRGLLTCFSSTLVSSCFAEGAGFFIFPAVSKYEV